MDIHRTATTPPVPDGGLHELVRQSLSGRYGPDAAANHARHAAAGRQALIDMIEASRAWDNQMNLITSARDMDTSAADLMRLP